MMNWRKERPLIGTEELNKGLHFIFSIPNFITQQISFETKKRIVDRQTVNKPTAKDSFKRTVPEELRRENI